MTDIVFAKITDHTRINQLNIQAGILLLYFVSKAHNVVCPEHFQFIAAQRRRNRPVAGAESQTASVVKSDG